MNKKYWIDCVSEAFVDAGISATEEQVKAVANDVCLASEMHSEVTGEINIPNPLIEENKKLEKLLKDEKSKISCKSCMGRGITHSYGPSYMSTSQCSKCHGDGKASP